jgi:cell division transport system permease protein
VSLIKTSLNNAIKNIGRNKLISLLCLAIIAFTLLIYGIFNYISYNLNLATREFSKSIEAIFYFRDNVKLERIEALIQRIESNLLVEKVTFNSRNQAEINFSRQFPELKYILSEFKQSPFPASMEISFKPEYSLDIKIASFLDEIEKMNIIESKQLNTEWAKKIMAIKKFISIVGLFLSSILLFVSVFIIYNVIKLNILYRKDEIHILKLVGATNWYIKFPFIIEGALLGFFGSLMASVFLFAVLKLFPTYATFMFDLIKGMVDVAMIPHFIFIRLIVLGTAIGLFSSLFSTQHFLKN